MTEYLNRWKNDYNFKTLVNSVCSFIITSIFTLYNGFLGLWYKSVWNGGICVYYIFLVLIRGTILLTEKRNIKREKNEIDKHRIRTFWQTSIILLLMNFALIVPISLMVYNERPVNMGSIPAISIASYTTYKITMAAINIKKMKKSSNILVRELRTINFIDALVSVLTLQNTLIIVNSGGERHDMFILSAISSASVFVVIAIISIKLIVRERKFLTNL